MQDRTNNSTLTVQGFTPYAQVPRWILRAGDSLSHGAVRLYGVIMTYADNTDRTAFPERETLAADMGVSVATIKRCIKELEDYKALSVNRRRNKRTGNFYANHYTLVFNNPWVTDDPRPKVTGDPVTTPISTTPTHSTSQLRRDDTFHDQSSIDQPFHEQPTAAREKSSAKQYDDHLPKEQWNHLKRLLQLTGEAVRDTEDFYSTVAQDRWADFETALEDHTVDLPYGDLILDLVLNGKWTVNARVADWYEAGAELNTLFNTARAC